MQKVLFTIAVILLNLSIKAQVGVGTNTPNQALDVETNNASKTAIDINNTSTGDAVIQLQINGESKFAVGVDNSDGDKFKISSDTTFGSAPAITVDNTQKWNQSNFQNEEYQIPEKMLTGKKAIRVKFQALPNNTAGAIYYIRLTEL